MSPCYVTVQRILSPDLDPSITAPSGVEEAFTEDPFPAVGTKVRSGVILFGDVAPVVDGAGYSAARFCSIDIGHSAQSVERACTK